MPNMLLSRGKLLVLLTVLTALLLGANPVSTRRASALATLPPNFIDTTIASTLAGPTASAFAPDGRLFVAEQGGALRVIKAGVLLPTPFVTVVTHAVGERGLLGVAFDPDFALNQFVYIYHTATAPTIHNRISRFTALGDVAMPGSEVVILELNDLSAATNHNGGAIHFGPDGKLYAGVGENANGANSQTLANLLGKMLRINADGTIPSDNPSFLTAAGQNRAIWALGLRNPFTFAFQPGTGRMFINDVGQSLFEEINDGIAGSNYGWPITEGPTADPSFRSPLFAYGHTGTPAACAISGGAFYAASQFPATYLGKYFFADLCGGWIHVFDPALGTATTFADNLVLPVDLQVGPDGSLYYIARGGGATTGTVGRISFVPGTPPSITSPNSATFTVGTAGSFNVTTTGNPATPMIISQTGTRPAGVNFVDNGKGTATLSGTPAAGSQGVYNLTFTADNGVPPIASQPFTLTVNPAAPVTPPTVTTTSPAAAITTTSASLRGNVTSIGGGPLSARGIVLAQNFVNPNPQIGGTGVTVLTDAASTIGIFSEGATGLLPGTNYAFKAFATNSGGTSYRSVVIFTTATQPPPVAAGPKQGAPVPTQSPTVVKKTFDGSNNATIAAVGGTATLTFTITNPNPTGLTGIGFVDTMPAGSGITVNAGSTVGSCNAGIILLTGTTVTLAGATLPASGSCSFSVTVTAATGGSWNNQVVANANGTGFGAPAAATLNVGLPKQPKSG